MVETVELIFKREASKERPRELLLRYAREQQSKGSTEWDIFDKGIVSHSAYRVDEPIWMRSTMLSPTYSAALRHGRRTKASDGLLQRRGALPAVLSEISSTMNVPDWRSFAAHGGNIKIIRAVRSGCQILKMRDAVVTRD